MALTTKPSQPVRHDARGSARRLWRAPTSAARWYWLAGSVVLYAGVTTWYFYALKTQQYPGPINDPLRLFGIIAYLLVLCTAIYSLRRRFVRELPGRVQDWLWMHTWFGLASLLIAFMHENYAYITHEYCLRLSCVTGEYFALPALYALVLLVISGVSGRLLDSWQTRIIAREASRSGGGIARALEERLLELEYSVERYCAGKSDGFKSYCTEVLRYGARATRWTPEVGSHEQADFQRVQETLREHLQLAQSLRRQRRARFIISGWRTLHIAIATLSLLVISYHAIMELLTNVFHVIKDV